jgi:hypothetical protein
MEDELAATRAQAEEVEALAFQVQDLERINQEVSGEWPFLLSRAGRGIL